MEGNQMQLDLKNIAAIFKRNILLLVFVPLIAVALTWQINENMTNIYEGSTSFLINAQPVVPTVTPGTNETTEVEALDPNTVANYQKLVGTYAELVESKIVYETVGAELGLSESTLTSLVDSVNVQTKELIQIITVSARAADQKLLQEFLTSLIATLEKVGVEKIGADMIQTLDVPSVSTTPVSPNKLTNLVIGAATGILLAIFIAFFRDYLDTHIYDAEGLMKVSSYPLIGQISRMKVTNAFVSDKKLRGSEAYRVLRIKVQNLAETQQVKAILVTSAVKDEGKTQILVNLGDLLAKSGKKVLMIDGNVRHPKIHTFFGLENIRGLTTLLQGQEALEKFEIKTSRKGIDVLLAGPTVENPDELLGSERFSQILNEVKNHYDFVLIDSSALLTYSDTLSLIRNVDATIMVSRAHKIKVGQLKRAQQYLEELDGNVMGIIANQFPVKK